MAKTPISKPKDNHATDTNRVVIITLDASNFDQLSHICGQSVKDAEAYSNKSSWLPVQFTEGMRYKLLQSNGRTAGFLEYIPGKYSATAVPI